MRLDPAILVAGIDLGGRHGHVLPGFGKGVAQGILGIGSRFFGKMFFGHFLDLDSDFKLAPFQLALFRFEDLTLGLDGVLLQVFLVGQDLGDVLDEVGHAAGLRGQDLLRLAEGLEGLLLVRHCVGSLGLGDLLDGAGHVRDRLALQEREFGPAKAAEGLLVDGFLARLHEGLEELTVAVNDGLLGAAQAGLVDLGGFLVPVGLDAPLLGLALHEFLGFDDLADLFHEEVVYQDGIGPGDDLSELLDDLLDGLARFRNVRVGVVGLAGPELLPGIGELITGDEHLLGAESPQRVTRLMEGDCAPFLGEAVGLKILEEEAEAAHDRGHAPAHPVLPVHLGTEPLLGAHDAVGPFPFLLRGAGEGQEARSGECQGEKSVIRFHLLLLWARYPLRFSVAKPPSGRPVPDCGNASVLRSALRTLHGTSLNTFRE